MVSVNKFLRENRDKDFVWGEHDCLLFTLKYLRDCQGKDFTARVMGQYSTEFGALKFLKKSGYKNLKDMLASNLVKVERPRKGLIALVDTQEGFAIGFVADYRICVVKEKGFGFLPLSQAKGFYEVSECHK